MVTAVPRRVGRKASVGPAAGSQVGWLILPPAGVPAPAASSTMLSEAAGALMSPWRWSSTVPSNESFRATVKLGPSTGVAVVAGRLMVVGGSSAVMRLHQVSYRMTAHKETGQAVE